MAARVLGRKFNDRDLVRQLRPLRVTDNTTNLLYLSLDLATLLAIVAPTILWSLYRQEIGLTWLYDIPTTLLAIVLVGAVQHRLAGLAHEASHFTLLKNRQANDLVADFFCMFPLLATIQQYRVAHLAHHQYANQWDRDPDLMQVGRPKGMHLFPMSRSQFLWHYFVEFLLPWRILGYLLAIMSQSVFGTGRNPYLTNVENVGPLSRVRWASLGGIAYVVGLAFIMRSLFAAHMYGSLLLAGASLYALVLGITWILPESAFFQSTVKQPYSSRTAAMLRLSWSTGLLAFFPISRLATGIDLAPYFWLLWVVPLLTSFSYFMLLRDVYQHANADDGRLTNTRVFFTDPFTWWAVFVYGQDMHVPHHLFPAIPHYHLEEAHRILKDQHEEYGRYVVECEGTFTNTSGRPTILDVMETPTREPIESIEPVPEFSASSFRRAS